MITPAQCKAARQLLGWDFRQLAAASSVYVTGVHQFELGQSKPRPETLEKLRSAFEQADVVFDGAGVRLRGQGAGTTITPAQCRAARQLLGWTYGDLARAALVGIETAVGFESGCRSQRPTQEKLRRALESAGVEFIAENGGGAGVRMRKPAE